MNAINKEPEHQEIEALLPWYAAGTLSRRDANRVEQALAGDRELARQYDLVRVQNRKCRDSANPDAKLRFVTATQKHRAF
jgi:anti-sigma-K factor RskA